MNCPVCNLELKIADRQGIEIDYCPKCRGVWLDRGELDKIIERSLSMGSAPEPRGERERGREEYCPERKKRSFLEDLFEFD